VVTTLLFLDHRPGDSKLAVSDPKFRVQRRRRRRSDLDCDATAYADFPRLVAAQTRKHFLHEKQEPSDFAHLINHNALTKIEKL
jgi:hypothetical protein